MIGEELQRDNGKDRAEAINHLRNFDDVVGKAFQLFCAATGGNGDDRALARFDLLDVV